MSSKLSSETITSRLGAIANVLRSNATPTDIENCAANLESLAVEITAGDDAPADDAEENLPAAKAVTDQAPPPAGDDGSNSTPPTGTAPAVKTRAEINAQRPGD